MIQRNRVISEKSQPSKYQDLKPSYFQGYYEINQKQNQRKTPDVLKNKLIFNEYAQQYPQNLNQSFESNYTRQQVQKMKQQQVKQINMHNDEQISRKKNIIIINQQSSTSKCLNKNNQNVKLLDFSQQQNNQIIHQNKYLPQMNQQASQPKYNQNHTEGSKSRNQRQNMPINLHYELGQGKFQNQQREIQEKQQVHQIKFRNEQSSNEYQIIKTNQAQDKKPKKQFESQQRNPEKKEQDHFYMLDGQPQDVQKQQDQENNQQISLNMSQILETTQDSQNEQNNILDSNTSITKTFNLECFACNLKIESISIQTPCQHSFHKTCINEVMKESLKQKGIQINCKCTTELPQYFIRNHNQELFKKLLEQQIKQIEKDQIENNKKDQTKEYLEFHATELLKEIQHDFETGEGIDILKCYYIK